MVTWTDHGPVMPPGIYEDAVVFKTDDRPGFTAWLVGGPSFQDQRLHVADGVSPLGPFDTPRRVIATGPDLHTRLYKGRIDKDTTLGSAIWPGLPSIGIWLFARMSFGDLKTILIPPAPPYSVVAANPCVRRCGKKEEAAYEIYFEGRGPEVRWSVYRARWDGDTGVEVDKTPVVENGANPSLLEYGGRLYLYYSKHVGDRFQTCALSRALEGAP